VWLHRRRSWGSCGGSDGGGSDKGGSTGDDTNAVETPLFPDDFEPVCQGATVSKATPYDAAAIGHKALYFATYEDSILDQSTELPADWSVTFSATGDALQAVDLVACAVRSAEQLVRTCTGYQDDGKDTGNEVRWHTATYDVSVREATTGTVLDQSLSRRTTRTAPAWSCSTRASRASTSTRRCPRRRWWRCSGPSCSRDRLGP